MSDFNIIGLCGKARAGKDTVADLLKETVEYRSYTKYAIASPLKNLVASTFENIPFSNIYGDKKEENVFISFKDIKYKLPLVFYKLFSTKFDLDVTLVNELPIKLISKMNSSLNVDKFVSTGSSEVLFRITTRKLLQLLGTDCVREIFGENFWLDCIPKDMDLFITDIRFQNEYDYVKNIGTIVHIQRDTSKYNVEAHSSEEGLPVGEGDIVIDNNGSKADLLFSVCDTLHCSIED